MHKHRLCMMNAAGKEWIELTDEEKIIDLPENESFYFQHVEIIIIVFS